MLGKLIAAIVGERLARRTGARGGGASGALLGLGAAALLRRLGPAGLIAAGAGSYLLKRHRAKQKPF
jgi:hypothetical protein